MAEPQTGTVTEIKLVPYDPTKDISLNVKSSFSPYNYHNIIENLCSVKETLILSINHDDTDTFPIVERSLDLGITQSWFYAMNCFAVSLYDPSVLFASIAVECILNHDMRLDEYRIGLNKNPDRQWINLNLESLEQADSKKLPIKLLCNNDDEFPKNVKFVTRRNKVAHGDIEGYAKIDPPVLVKLATDVGYITQKNRPTKEDALDQIEKAKNFIVAWANQKPKVRLQTPNLTLQAPK